MIAQATRFGNVVSKVRSFDLVNAVRDARGLSGPAKAVMFAIASRADSEGRAWPTIETISEDSGFCRRTVQRSLSELVDSGVLVIDRMSGGSNQWGRNTYTISLPTLQALRRPASDADQAHLCHPPEVDQAQEMRLDQAQQSHPPGAPGAPKETSEETILEETIKTVAPVEESNGSKRSILGSTEHGAYFNTATMNLVISHAFKKQLEADFPGIDLNSVINRAEEWAKRKYVEARSALPKHRWDKWLRGWVERGILRELRAYPDGMVNRGRISHSNRCSSRIDFGDNSPTVQAMRAKGLM